MWFKIHDGFDSDPKILAAGNPAIGLWTRCGAWSMKQLTDGFVPEQLAKMYGNKPEIERLIDVGLWEAVEGGYRFINWSKYQPSRKEVEDKRDYEAQRQREWRQKKKQGVSV